jgi:hypothetical protein
MKAPSIALVVAALAVGRTFIRLEIETVNGAISGGIGLGELEVDREGLVRRAEAAPANLTPIFDVTMHGSTMTFSTKDGNDTDRFELRLIENATADLHVLVSDDARRQFAAEGVTLPKPIRLTKAG